MSSATQTSVDITEELDKFDSGEQQRFYRPDPTEFTLGMTMATQSAFFATPPPTRPDVKTSGPTVEEIVDDPPVTVPAPEKRAEPTPVDKKDDVAEDNLAGCDLTEEELAQIVKEFNDEAARQPPAEPSRVASYPPRYGIDTDYFIPDYMPKENQPPQRRVLFADAADSDDDDLPGSSRLESKLNDVEDMVNAIAEEIETINNLCREVRKSQRLLERRVVTMDSRLEQIVKLLELQHIRVPSNELTKEPEAEPERVQTHAPVMLNIRRVSDGKPLTRIFVTSGDIGAQVNRFLVTYSNYHKLACPLTSADIIVTDDAVLTW